MASWKNLPDVVFCDIMMMTGLNSLEDLHRCRQVSQSWNVKIAQMTKYKKVTIRDKAESLASQIIKESRSQGQVILFSTSVPKIVTAASLTHHGMLDSVQWLILYDVDLASVPAEHLASLASCASCRLYISNVSNSDIFSILDSVKCKQLHISRQTLSTEETRALVRAMEAQVEMVRLGFEGWREVNLDITTLTQYNGQGKCRRLDYYNENDTADRYREEVRRWAEKINWRVTTDTRYLMIMINMIHLM